MAFGVDSVGELAAVHAVITAVYQAAFFAVAATCKFDKVTDFAGGTNFVVIAVVGLLIGTPRTNRQIGATVCVCLWGIRLSGFLLARIIAWGEDRRFDDKRKDFFKFLAFWVAQAIWVMGVSLPVTVLNSRDPSTDPARPMGALDYAGYAAFACGLLLETVADKQKLAFKADPSKAGRWCDAGVWSWSRHPNYAGEMALWWGVCMVCYAGIGPGAPAWVWALCTCGPVLCMLLLLGLSGAPILEASANRRYSSLPEYHTYRHRTSPVVPLPPALYGAVPAALKTVLLFEWPAYRTGLEPPSGGDGGSEPLQGAATTGSA